MCGQTTYDYTGEYKVFVSLLPLLYVPRDRRMAESA